MSANEQAVRVLAAVDAAARELNGTWLDGQAISFHAPVEVLEAVAAQAGCVVEDLGLTPSNQRVFMADLTRHGLKVSLLGSRPELVEVAR